MKHLGLVLLAAATAAAAQIQPHPAGLDPHLQVVDYVERDAGGRILRRGPERLTYYVADPEPFAAAAGLNLERPPQRLGGVGDVWVFRRA